MTTIKIGNQEVELEAAKKLYDDAMSTPHDATAQQMTAFDALSTAIKEAEEVEGPFGRDGNGDLTFCGEVVKEANGEKIPFAYSRAPALNRILSQHFVSKDELREAMASQMTYSSELRHTIRALIEKGAPDA